jgi:hypothetical protein
MGAVGLQLARDTATRIPATNPAMIIATMPSSAPRLKGLIEQSLRFGGFGRDGFSGITATTTG